MLVMLLVQYPMDDGIRRKRRRRAEEEEEGID